MYDCSKDVLGHHDDEVTLPQGERNNMRSRRDANRGRLRKGLKNAGRPAPLEFVSQGSYAMKTMVQHPESDYDIDDGVYFDKGVLVGDRGAEMSALQARQMVRNALDDGSFARPPEVRKNCVRVYYQAGYHVDAPVYRRVVTRTAWGTETFHYELASTDWKRSDAREVTGWFDAQNNSQSPDTGNGRQLRRVTRQVKKFARSRPSWSGQILSGFGMTKLVTECFWGNAGREDEALYYTMRNIRDRLNRSLVVVHPVTPNEAITKGVDDPHVRFLRDRLTEAINTLEPLHEYGCTRAKALSCWDRVFATDYFSSRDQKATPGSLMRAASVAPHAVVLTFPSAPRADDKPRGFG